MSAVPRPSILSRCTVCAPPARAPHTAVRTLLRRAVADWDGSPVFGCGCAWRVAHHFCLLNIVCNEKVATVAINPFEAAHESLRRRHASQPILVTASCTAANPHAAGSAAGMQGTFSAGASTDAGPAPQHSSVVQGTRAAEMAVCSTQICWCKPACSQQAEPAGPPCTARCL